MPFGIVAENISVRRSAGRRFEDEFEILAKAEVEHLVGFVENDGRELFRVQSATLDVIAQAAGRADDDMSALRELAALESRVHAADAGHDPRVGACS